VIQNAIGSIYFNCLSILDELKNVKNVNIQTYQIQQEKPFRMVIHNLHHTNDINFIKEELKVQIYTAVQVVNVLQWQTSSFIFGFCE